MSIVTLLLCVAYAILYGLLLGLIIAVIGWLCARIPQLAGLSALIMGYLQAIVAVVVVIMLILCIFGGAGRFDVFHFHP